VGITPKLFKNIIMPKINIAIDGPAGSGKTTIGNLLAQKLKYQFLDSGLLYRHFAWFFQNNNASLPISQEKLDSLLSEWQKIIFKDKKKMLFQLENEREKLTSPQLSILTSQLSPYPELRQIILDFQRELTKNKGYVVCGRDITFKVLPDAEAKIFLDANLESRVKRKQIQFQEAKIFLSLAEIEKELKERDQRDQERIYKARESAFKIDTSNLKEMEVVEKICELLKLNRD
jgi:cytidylate kinase